MYFINVYAVESKDDITAAKINEIGEHAMRVMDLRDNLAVTTRMDERGPLKDALEFEIGKYESTINLDSIKAVRPYTCKLPDAPQNGPVLCSKIEMTDHTVIYCIDNPGQIKSAIDAELGKEED